MPRTTLAVQNIDLGDLVLLTENAADAGNGNQFANDGNTVLVVSNEDGSTASTVTVGVNPDKYGRDRTLTLSVTAGRVGFMGPFPPEVYNNSSGMVEVDFSSATNVKVMPAKLKMK